MRNKNIAVTHNPEEHRFELTLDGHLAVLDYILTGNTIVFTHTGVTHAISGRDPGVKVAQTGLEYARENGLGVRSKCWFVSKYIRRHPEYQDLLE